MTYPPGQRLKDYFSKMEKAETKPRKRKVSARAKDGLSQSQRLNLAPPSPQMPEGDVLRRIAWTARAGLRRPLDSATHARLFRILAIIEEAK